MTKSQVNSKRYWKQSLGKLKAFGWGFAAGVVVTAIYTVIKK